MFDDDLHNVIPRRFRLDLFAAVQSALRKQYEKNGKSVGDLCFEEEETEEGNAVCRTYRDSSEQTEAVIKYSFPCNAEITYKNGAVLTVWMKNVEWWHKNEPLVYVTSSGKNVDTLRFNVPRDHFDARLTACIYKTFER